MNEIAAATRALAARVGNMLARGRVRSVKSTTKMQTLQVDLLDEETKDRMEHFEPYGFTSHPKAGAEVIAGFFDGDRSHGIVIMVADRRYRLTTMAEGEVAIQDDIGQKVHLTRSGIVVDGGGNPITLTNAPKVRMETALLEVTGQVKDLCDTTGKTMAGMRTTFNGHTHHENDVHGETNTPSQSM